ncbi:MAG: HAD-superfamily hydrolase, subfamily IA, variant 3 [Candidatus Gottesmanbacteria bacterium GW2011_GWA1_34_13]|uniref:HAD-superfamily hydrolase, subfamily IA, variant 3 n=1 Tax=Candidatus Gottesmanbacteria bacterium GW2011_GWA1_34_13 TaxID=1618434 RepID=A0A0G0D7Q5_9BACT|nr:MAG: HAD-superfamily hydrolase, subfamily IA, variant 3 [Candidatus Gottesmanbacteria bacterium GW2011_GWA1_34_13]
MLKAVIFDFDGLLCDSTPLHREANYQLLNFYKKVKLPSIGSREGMRINEIMQDYKDVYNLPGTIEEIYKIRQSFFYEIVKNKLEIFPDAYPLLEKIKQKNIKIALATSGDASYINLVFKKFPKFAKYFAVLVTGDEVERGKPYPDIYTKTIQLLDIKPQESVVLEDSINGIFSAHAAGIPVICVPNKHYSEADYSQADKIFSSLKEVTQALVF